MKNFGIFYLLAIMSLGLVSCSDSDAGIDIVSSDTIVVEERPDGPPNGAFLQIAGSSSTLDRHENGLIATFKTKNLIPNNAYTLWWIIFEDTPGPPAQYYADGIVAGESGEIELSASKEIDDAFSNPLTGRVDMVIRTHGPARQDIVSEQISSFGGGCIDSISFDGGPGLFYPDSDQIGRCANIQVAVHPGG